MQDGLRVGATSVHGVRGGVRGAHLAERAGHRRATLGGSKQPTADALAMEGVRCGAKRAREASARSPDLGWSRGGCAPHGKTAMSPPLPKAVRQIEHSSVSSSAVASRPDSPLIWACIAARYARIASCAAIEAGAGADRGGVGRAVVLAEAEGWLALRCVAPIDELAVKDEADHDDRSHEHKPDTVAGAPQSPSPWREARKQVRCGQGRASEPDERVARGLHIINALLRGRRRAGDLGVT